MSASGSQMQTIKEWVNEHRGVILAVIAVIAAILLIVGLTLSWFLTNKDLSTVGKVDSPAELKVLGPNQTATEQLDITYDADSDITTSDGTVVRRRAFCVWSDGKGFELQVANTTNISGMTVNVYRVTENDSSVKGDVVDRDSLGKLYSWSKKGNPIQLTAINPSSDNSAQAAVPGAGTTNDPTFGSYENVQKNARPLYRYASFGTNASSPNVIDWPDDKSKATNFIVECTWPEGQNYKETDMVYLIARTASAS